MRPALLLEDIFRDINQITYLPGVEEARAPPPLAAASTRKQLIRIFIDSLESQHEEYGMAAGLWPAFFHSNNERHLFYNHN